MNEELLREKIIAILIDYPKGFTNKTIERIIDLFYQLQDRKRTSSQNNAIHLDCKLIADKLEERGLDMKKVIRLDIPPTMYNVKENIWKIVMKKMFGKISTRDLEKSSNEIKQIHDVIMRELGKEWGIEYHEFPFDPKKRKEWEDSLIGKSDLEYPKEEQPEITDF